MYQDEVDMMEIELLGRDRAECLAAERAAAEASGRAELARLQATLLATEQKLDIAKKRLHFPAAKGYGCAAANMLRRFQASQSLNPCPYGGQCAPN